MQFGYNWLKKISGTALSVDEAVGRLTMLGIEVESCENPARFDYAGIVVGRVLDASKIEGSDHLSICKVSVGDTELQIVCGAPNVAAGQKVPVAAVGAVLPSGMKIRKAKLRGALSQGMICSEAELGISQESSGIMVLSGDASVGQDFGELVSVEDDAVIEVAVTPNRPDCLGMVGIARELCLNEKRAFALEQDTFNGILENPETYKVRLKDASGCPRYTARIIRDVKITPSPDWLAQRLESAGVRAINNVVDATNYVMLLTGQPLHAFDLDKLQNQEIIVRLAKSGEKFTTLDGKEHDLKENNLLICDGDNPVALAGIMGGENSEVNGETTNLLLEAAYFSPESIRRSIRQLSLFTESGRRFERGVDPNGCDAASNIATKLILDTAGGDAASNLIDAYPKKIERKKIKFRPSRVSVVIGEKIDSSEISRIFEGLDCTSEKSGDVWTVSAPTFRPDLEREIDLVEEVVRVYGYDNVAPRFVDKLSLEHTPNRTRVFTEDLRKICLNAALSEIITFSMTNEKFSLPFVEEESRLVRLLNPLSEDLAVLRPSLLSTMLAAIAYNINRKQTQLRFFEIGSVFYKNKSEKIVESQHLGGAMTGSRFHASWQEKSNPLSFFDLKGVVSEVLARIGVNPPLEFNPVKTEVFEYGAEVRFRGRTIGSLGKVSKNVCALFEVSQDVFAFEFDCKSLSEKASRQETFQNISPFPEVERDLAIVVDKSIPASKIEKLLREKSGKLLTNLSLFDVYEGKSIAEGKKSLAYSLKFQSHARTIRAREIEKILKNVVRQLKRTFDATLRA